MGVWVCVGGREQRFYRPPVSGRGFLADGLCEWKMNALLPTGLTQTATLI